MLTPLALRVISRIRRLNRSRDFGAIVRLKSGPAEKLNPRNFRSCGRATALLKVLLCNTHAETRKLWKRSAGLPPLEAIPVDQFTGRPLLHFTRLPRCPLHYLRFPGMLTLHFAS